MTEYNPASYHFKSQICFGPQQSFMPYPLPQMSHAYSENAHYSINLLHCKRKIQTYVRDWDKARIIATKDNNGVSHLGCCSKEVRLQGGAVVLLLQEDENPSEEDYR